jgi:hypothetical protein
MRSFLTPKLAVPAKVLTLVLGIVALAALCLLESEWVVVTASAIFAGIIVRLARQRKVKLAIASVVLAAIVIFAYKGITPMFHRWPRVPIDAQYDAALTYLGETPNADGWVIHWRLEEQALIAAKDMPAVNRASRSGTPMWTIASAVDGRYRCTTSNVVDESLARFAAVSLIRIPWSRFGVLSDNQMGARLIPSITVGTMRVRAPQHLISRTTPASSRAIPITRERTEITIPLTAYDKMLEAEILHPWLRNTFGVWLRDFSLWETPKWAGGILIGVMAAGLGDLFKRLLARLKRSAPARVAGFKPPPVTPSNN